MAKDAPIVLIVDDDPSICSSVKRMIRASGLDAQTFNSTEQLARFGRPKGPCCLILDVHMPGVGGLDFMDVLHRAGVRVPIIFITGAGDIPSTVRAIKGGAADFLPKPFDADELLVAVRRALEVDARALVEDRERAILRRNFRSLTDREREVFLAVTGGLLNKQVGSRLGVTEKTIKVHRGRVMEKMEAESLAALVRMAVMLQLDPTPTNDATAPSSTDAFLSAAPLPFFSLDIDLPAPKPRADVY